MEIELFIKNMKEIYPSLLSFIEATEDSDSEFATFVNLLEDLKIFDEKDQIVGLFELISRISVNRHRTPTFFNKMEKLFQYCFTDNKSSISFSEMIEIFEKDKRLLLLLIEQNYVQPDTETLTTFLNKKDSKGFKNEHYFYRGIKQYLDENNKKRIEDEINKEYNETIEAFEEKCKIGENDSIVCSLIRQDSIKEFVAYVNRNNLPISGRINPSIYETNSFIIENEKPTLIEYAAFFGSIEIFHYLRLNRVELKGSLWLFTVHSNNAELIHLLEGNIVKPEDNTYEECFQEAIKCHFNNVADYIKDNLLLSTENGFYNEESDLIEENASCITESYNFHYLPNNIIVSDLISNQKNPFGFYLSILCFSIKTVTIPSSITTIGEKAFEECNLLKEIKIPSSVKKIESTAFSECKSLKLIKIPSSINSIENYVFSQCSSLTEISIPSTVKKIGIYAFSQCTSLEEVTIPSSVTMIEMSSFSKCSSLKNLTIPSSIISIGENAFSECISLTYVVIPSSVTKIGGGAFSQCTQLIFISIPSSVKIIGHHCFKKCSSLKQVIIPASVNSIGNGAFSECSSLVQVLIDYPSSLTSFGEDTFLDCKSLKQILIPSSVTSLGNGTFNNCSSLPNIILPPKLTSFGRNVFCNCSSLTSILIPSSVTIIGRSAFSNCSSLTKIVFEFPSSVSVIDDSAFLKCKSLECVKIPSSVTSINREAFIGCTGLKQISIPSTTEYYYTFSPNVEVIRT